MTPAAPILLSHFYTYFNTLPCCRLIPTFTPSFSLPFFFFILLHLQRSFSRFLRFFIYFTALFPSLSYIPSLGISSKRFCQRIRESENQFALMIGLGKPRNWFETLATTSKHKKKTTEMDCIYI